MDLFFFFDKLGFQQPGRLSERAWLCSLSRSLSLRVGGLPGRDCIETRAAPPPPFLKTDYK